VFVNADADPAPGEDLGGQDGVLAEADAAGVVDGAVDLERPGRCPGR
jgi:hypothetical protein